jgi:hypothetical protein
MTFAKAGSLQSALNGKSQILGQVNFFREFNLCFYSSQLAFEISLKTSKSYESF